MVLAARMRADAAERGCVWEEQRSPWQRRRPAWCGRTPLPSTTIRPPRPTWACSPDLVQVLTALLSQAPTVHNRANDLLRAARLPLLDGGNPEVAKDLKKIDAREALSPVLLIRGDLACGHPLQVADGYHRICASYAVDEDTEIACRIVALPAVAV
jgi:hypothetical protein